MRFEFLVLFNTWLQVEADPARLLAPTAATAAAQAAAEEAEALRRAGLAGAFNPVQGFTTEQVLRDQRFKVRGAGRVR